MTHSIGYYTSYRPHDTRDTERLDQLLHDLQERYGATFEVMTYEQKIVMRSALTLYISLKPVSDFDCPGCMTLMQSCIDRSGVDWDVWTKEAELCRYVERCDSLHERDIEGLIRAISEQIYAASLRFKN